MATGFIYGEAQYSLVGRRASSSVLVIGGNKDKIKEARSNNLE